MVTRSRSLNSNVKILIVEDSPTQAEQLCHILEKHGYAVSAANNGKNALALMEKEQPELILSDIVMPEMDGYELCRAIKSDRRWSSIPIILLTSLSDPADIIRGLFCAADNFVTKPYEEEYLISRLKNVLINRELRRHGGSQLGIEIFFAGQRHAITSDRLQILDLLLSTYETAVQKNVQLTQAQNELRTLNEELDRKVQDRTAVLAAEIAVRKLSELRVKQLNQLYATLSGVNRTIIETRDRDSLFLSICRVVIDVGKFGLVWIGLIDQQSGKVTVSVVYGSPVQRIPFESMNYREAPFKDDLIGMAISQGTIVHMEDIQSEPAMSHWHVLATTGNYRSAATIPFKLKGEIIGIMTLFSKELSFFGSTEQLDLLEEMAKDISFALENIEREKERAVIEEKKSQLERQVIQVQKLDSIGTLASGIAHDFNNILAIILGHASSLHRVQADPPKFARSVEAIENASQRGASLVRQLLTFARKADVDFHPVSLNDVIEEITKLARTTFPKVINLSIDLEKDLPFIFGDQTQLHQVLLNLCVNARDAMPRGGNLTVRTITSDGKSIRQRFPTATADRYIMLQVQDTGSGMTESTLQKIFEPFFTTKEHDKGTGLGLSVVHGIVQDHQGFVDVSSEVGKGTTFTIYLPVFTGPISADENTKTIIEEIHGGNENILVIEDEGGLRELLKAFLESKGYKVITASDGEEGVNVFMEHKNEISVVVTDYGLPLLSGAEVLERIHKVKPTVPVILASGFFDPSIKSQLQQAGVNRFLQKPYLPSEVLLAVRKTIDERR